MKLTQRTMEYDPREHLLHDYPTWFVTCADLGGRTHEVSCPEMKLMVVDPAAFDGDQDWALAHVAAHFTNHAAHISQLTGEHCSQADYLALLWLDRECDRLEG